MKININQYGQPTARLQTCFVELGGLPETGGAGQSQVAQETWRIQANLQIPPVLNIRYPGQYYDFETGLVQNWWRTYEPKIGRYTSADPIGLNGGWNRFAYAGQDGVNGFDPDGLRKIVNLGKGYTGGIDVFETRGASSFEMHVYDEAGKEIGIYGPNGWFDKHGLKGAPNGLPSSVEAQCKGQAIDVGRRMGKVPLKGNGNISGNKWKKFFGKIPLLGPLIEITTPSPERGCNINPNAEYC